VLEALKHTDFRRRVLLEGWTGEATARVSGEFRPARIRDYRANRVTIDVPDGTAGYLLLADVWYPGWRCRIDGELTHVWRADFLFRAVALSAGAHEVVFSFEPESYSRGRAISGITAGFVAAIVGIPILRRWLHREGAAVSADRTVAEPA
jgi:hypothetical protein